MFSKLISFTGKEQKQAMLELELKYIEITREIVLKRAEDLYEIDSAYCIKMFDLGLEQLKINFEMQQEHNRIKHQKVRNCFILNTDNVMTNMFYKVTVDLDNYR